MSGAGTWASLADDRKAQFGGLAVHVAHHFWSLVNEDTPLEAYVAVDVPTLILCGTRSPRPSRAITRLLADTLPRARHRTNRNANRMSPLTHVAEVNPVIFAHLLSNRIGMGCQPHLDSSKLRSQPVDPRSSQSIGGRRSVVAPSFWRPLEYSDRGLP